MKIYCEAEGNMIMIQQTKAEYLQLCEVKIFETDDLAVFPFVVSYKK